MCIICVQFQQGKLTVKEAVRNLGEMVRDEHQEELLSQLNEQLGWGGTLELEKDDDQIAEHLSIYEELGIPEPDEYCGSLKVTWTNGDTGDTKDIRLKKMGLEWVEAEDD